MTLSRDEDERVIRIGLPVKIVSEANLRSNRWLGSKRVKAQREAARDAVTRAIGAWKTDAGLALIAPLTVTITRIAPSRIDSDNLAGGCKAIRDGVADALGIDDRDPSVVYLYDQRKGAVREYACEIAIVEGRSCPMCGGALA